MYVFMYVCMYVCMYVYICMYVCMYLSFSYVETNSVQFFSSARHCPQASPCCCLPLQRRTLSALGRLDFRSWRIGKFCRTLDDCTGNEDGYFFLANHHQAVFPMVLFGHVVLFCQSWQLFVLQEILKRNPGALQPVFFSGILAFAYNALQHLGIWWRWFCGSNIFERKGPENRNVSKTWTTTCWPFDILTWTFSAYEGCKSWPWFALLIIPEARDLTESQSLICWTFEKVVLFRFLPRPCPSNLYFHTLEDHIFVRTIFFWRRLTIFFEANVWCHFFTECLTKSPRTQTAWAGDARYALVHRLSATHTSFAGNFNMVPGSHGLAPDVLGFHPIKKGGEYWDLGFNHFRYQGWEV